MNLMSHFNNWYLGSDYSINAFVKLPCLTKNPLVIINHNIFGSKWDRHNEELINWYIREYWSELDCDEDIPQFLIFLNIKYQKIKKFIKVPKLLKFNRFYKDEIQKRLHDFLKLSDNRCPCLVIRELMPITIEHVKEWFSLYNIVDNQLIQNERLNLIFKENDRPVTFKSWSEIEILLDKILTEYFQERKL